MNADNELPSATMIDVVFPLLGHCLARDHRLALADAIEVAAPVWAGLPRAGIHPIHLVANSGEPALLSQRARLVLRVPRNSVDLVEDSLADRELDVDGHRVKLGMPHRRGLLPHNTLYAHFVAVDHGEDEGDFLAAINAELDALGARCHRVCGRRQHYRGREATLVGYSLMLHGLAAGDSLRVLEAGIGRHRRLGAGVFVPHRSAAAVGV